jgi:uncharacterized membrane protein
MVGPIQMILFGFERTDRFRGEITRELEWLSAKGVIRIIDVLFVKKDETGEIVALEGSPLSEDERIEFGAVIGGLLGMGAGGVEGAIEGAVEGAMVAVEKHYGLTWSDVQEMADELEPGTAAAVLLFEHTWATGFAEALQDAGGYMLAQGFLTRDALMMVGAELEAMVEAQEAIELADEAKALAVLDALETVIEAEEIKEEAIAEAADAVVAAEVIKALAAADALRALIAAELIEEVAAERALEALVAADLIEQAALEAATEAAERA